MAFLEETNVLKELLFCHSNFDHCGFQVESDCFFRLSRSSLLICIAIFACSKQGISLGISLVLIWLFLLVCFES